MRALHEGWKCLFLVKTQQRATIYHLLLTDHLLVADVLEALPHPLHLVAQLVLLLQRMHPLFQVNLPPAQTSVKVETIGGRKVVVAKLNSLTVFFTCSLSLLSVSSLSTVADNLITIILNLDFKKLDNFSLTKPAKFNHRAFFGCCIYNERNICLSILLHSLVKPIIA